ncbi:[LSU ribosomal protein L11P]-lysine N-methyltransferase [Lachnotalea glycerini]|uniref:Ribosomal protein L11 methyltransferase n=1 Tax=Lachnotalea glycerini TaxID=1763509 RepID=A0A255I2F8_9FIRM|nr:50S ribosomal protein L11 methyltransferase [Lachnotalea glycerini]PXV93478.1 [LSU ribosomal protein L11P]-lysine N-methyltransferase [Lachnotalea glycerini]RDY32442.1 50S ribosomal protein L11 methyltransferase [Lachnotalea glycerini]
MKWNKYTLKTITEAEDIISSTLMDLGVEGVEIEDKVPLSESDKKQMFVDILPDIEPDDNIAYISFYIDSEVDASELLENVKTELKELSNLMDIGECSIVSSQTEDKDWINNWKQYFKQFTVDDILIKPSWEEVKPEDHEKLMIQIDPGTAFGTGMHETTQLCIRQLKKYITKTTKLLDVGCGSGILSIVSLKLGADHALGLDIDPNAINASKENAQVNHIPDEKFNVQIGNILEDGELQGSIGIEKYDIVVANILADVLISLTPIILKNLKTGGYYITSGIIDMKEEAVVTAVNKSGLEVVEVTYQGEWVSVTARKK